nr:hypothetical protein [Cupriavidus sp. SK-3]
MKHLWALGAVGSALLFSMSSARAQPHVNVDVGIGVAGSPHVAPAPVYMQPAPVAGPALVYYEPYWRGRGGREHEWGERRWREREWQGHEGDRREHGRHGRHDD